MACVVLIVGAQYFRAGGPENIYSVLLVVEGGPVTLQVVQKSIENNLPVVVVEGSGRAADILSYAWRMLHCERLAFLHVLQLLPVPIASCLPCTPFFPAAPFLPTSHSTPSPSFPHASSPHSLQRHSAVFQHCRAAAAGCGDVHHHDCPTGACDQWRV